MKKKIITMSLCIAAIVGTIALLTFSQNNKKESVSVFNDGEKEYIKWVDFSVSYTALCQSSELDIASYGKDIHINFIDLLAYAACKNGGKFSEKKNSDISSLASRLEAGERIEDITSDMKYFEYYKEAYTAVLGNFIGEYQTEVDGENNDMRIERRYGIKAFLPVAYGYSFSHFSDFGVSRSFGFSRRHEGNDLVASVGTPVICVETGTIEEMGWNRFGGWRVGIRSLDKKRYYYYAHLRKGHPFVLSLSKGQIVNGGDVIGYVGMTGYSTKEDYNGMNVPHLHFGMQLIFDESQKDAVSQIWIDVYNIVRFLQKNPSLVVKNESTGEFTKKYRVFSNITSE